jgi:probable HAF family extracellular repeat protein
MIDFGTLEGTYHGLPWDINEAGEVVGICRNETPTREDHACLWREDTGWIDLGRLSEDANSQAKSMNNRGVVVGKSELTSGHRHPFLWTEKDGMVDLGALHEWPNNMAHGINEHNQVVGRSYNFDGNGSGFMWTTHTGMVELDPLWVWIDGYWFDGSEANDINELGQIVGISFDTYMEYRKRAVVWTPNPLPNIGSHHTEFTISGSGFGDKEGKVLIDGKKLKVLEWSDTSIRCRIKQNCKNMEPGVYDLIIIPKEPKGAETIVMEEAFIFAGIED